MNKTKSIWKQWCGCINLLDDSLFWITMCPSLIHRAHIMWPFPEDNAQMRLKTEEKPLLTLLSLVSTVMKSKSALINTTTVYMRRREDSTRLIYNKVYFQPSFNLWNISPASMDGLVIFIHDCLCEDVFQHWAETQMYKLIGFISKLFPKKKKNIPM